MAAFLFAAACLSWPCSTASAADAVSRPNIVFLFADDLGYGDLACYGAPDVATPHLDKLAAQGVRFTQFYSNGPECSPTRTALFTGRYQQRVGGLECAIGTGNVGRYDDAIRLAEQHQLGLPPELSNLPRGLSAAGYLPVIFGKWHLGYEPHFNPLDHGFAQFFGILGGNSDYFLHTEDDGAHVLYAGREEVQREGYLTHLLVDQATEFLSQPHDRPFFLYVPFTVPHSPYQAPGDATGQAISRDDWNRGTRAKYNEMIVDMDTQIGRVLAALEATGRAEDTLVVFASDNGGTSPGSNAPLSGSKGTTMEGGIRVPLIVRWPGKLPANVVSSQPCITFDLTASFLAVAGAAPEFTGNLEGIDILDHVGQGQPDASRTLYWRGRRGERTWRAVRDGDLKLVRLVDGDRSEEWLFDLAADPGEANNLLDARTDDAERLRALLAAWEEEVRPTR